MNFKVPKKASALLLYIWKIIEQPSISLNDLLYQISFNLFILPPKKTKAFITLALKKNLLQKVNGEKIALSNNLQTRLDRWQQKRKEIIQKNIADSQVISTVAGPSSTEGPEFNVLYKSFADKGTINRAVSVSRDSFTFITLDKTQGIVKLEVQGSKEEPYQIEINRTTQLIKHDCHDYRERRKRNKKFCKHLAKLFLILKDKDEEFAVQLLQNLSETIDQWSFET
ncbi:MAG: hypothetical protein ACOC44_01215 [Promethearchaeia archaeon]